MFLWFTLPGSRGPGRRPPRRKQPTIDLTGDGDGEADVDVDVDDADGVVDEAHDSMN